MTTNDDLFTRSTTRSRRPHAATGPVIDQEGRVVEPAPLGQSPFGAAFEFRLGGGANPFGPLTRDQRIARLEALTNLLDVAFVMPGTNVRYGIDALIGLVPVIGDIVTTAIALWIVREARALGAPWHLTARMLGNVAIDGVVGAVPLVGDAFDVMFKANIRNMKMLRKWLDKQPQL
ncbi:MAG: hypothetical protein JWQ82_617 [Tardiphaga sp.]|nr:hypothetical protein [Tardiphaga sp.]MDB5573774.1 hypothetical protein [Tardiphaga sp.]